MSNLDKKRSLALISVGVGLSTWMIDSLFDFFLLKEHAFTSELIYPSDRELIIRLMISFTSGIFSYFYLKLRQAGRVLAAEITERKKTEKLLNESRVAAEKANHAKDEFLSLLSHELRTPLTSILGWIQLLRMGNLNEEKTKQGLEVVEKSAITQGQLINDLLDISRIQAGKLNLEIQGIDPNAVISAAIDSTRTLAAAKSIQIETMVDPTIKKIFADPMRLQQILWNLITNSIKFSPQKAMIWIKIDRIATPKGEHICIHVRDNGKGIKPEFLPIIFDRFSQADSTTTRAYGGLGLGLAIVKELTEMHDGTIKVESEGEGKGTSFTICLPTNRIADQITLESEPLLVTEPEISLHGLRILVVEDDSSSREVLDILLQSFGAEVIVAASAKEGLEIFERLKPDVLVSDITMPVEDGYSLIAKIRALKSELSKTPALALTAYAGAEDIQRMLLAGFQAHLPKPADTKKLVLAISRLVGRK